MGGSAAPFVVVSSISSFNNTPTRGFFLRVCHCWWWLLFLLLLISDSSFVSRFQNCQSSSSSSSIKIVVSAFATTTPSSSSPGNNNNQNNNKKQQAQKKKKKKKGMYDKDNYSWLDKEKYTWREEQKKIIPNNDNINNNLFVVENNNNNNRGARYESLNSTIPTATEAAMKVGVQPPLNVSAQTWKRAWIIHRTATPWLHKFDKYAPPDSKLCLMCLWWKALSGNNRNSPVFDNQLHYDMLPSISRRVLRRPLKWFYPRLHHSNVEIRTAYLDQAVQKAISMVYENQSSSSQGGSSKKKKIRLISMGAGYDLRSVKLRLQGLVDKAYELDLPDVVDSKSLLLTKRLQRRRPNEITDDILPTLYKVDLNDINQFESTIQNILLETQEEEGDWHTIFLFEAVMIYLDEGIPTRLLQICHKLLGSSSSQLQQQEAAAASGGGGGGGSKTDGASSSSAATLCFADRLEDIPGAALKIAHPVLEATGWDIVEWHPKPGLARHMGMLVPLIK